MKLLVKISERVFETGHGRCSDGSYTSITSRSSVNIYSDTKNLKMPTAIVIKNFISKNTSSYDDRAWGGWHNTYEEKFDLHMTEKLKSEIPEEDVEISNLDEDCQFLLNSIAIESIQKHQSAISELEKKKSKLLNKYNLDLDICKAEIVKQLLNTNIGSYDVNEIIPDFNLKPIEVARLTNDFDFFEKLITNGATIPNSNYNFGLWFCKNGQFEFLERFIDLSKLVLRNGITIGKEIYAELTEYILYYSIVYNRLDIFNKYGSEKFGVTISHLGFKETNPDVFGPNISVGEIALKHSDLTTVKKLFDKYSLDFYIEDRKIGRVLSEDCFRDFETTCFFMDKLLADAIFAMLHWNKIELLQKFIESNKYNLSNIYLVAFSVVFKEENNYIIEQLAKINSFNLAKNLNVENKVLIPKFFNNKLRKESVLDSCCRQKNYNLLEKLFSISIKKKEIQSYDACRLLFNLFKYDDKQELGYFKQIVLKLINKTDLPKLLSIACVEENVKLLKFLIIYVKDINAFIDLEPTLFGLDSNNFRRLSPTEYIKGTILHLFLQCQYTNNNLNYEIIEILLNAGVDKSIKDESGRAPFDYILGILNYRLKNRNIDGPQLQQMKDLAKSFFTEGTKICYRDGEIIPDFKVTDLPIVKKFEEYVSKEINAVRAYKTNNIEALNFFLSCGAKIESIKYKIETETERKNEDHSNYSNDDSYSEQELRDMYRDAFDGNPDAEWNID